MNNVTIVIGAQWGDEGKGKWVDILAENADVVARFQGGNNAGHTLYINGEKTVLHQIPSGILREGQLCALTAGVVVNPTELVQEIENVRTKSTVTADRLWVSARAHVITPWATYLDHLGESQRKNPIGTTKRGIGPTYAEKAARNGLRLGYFVQDKARKEWLDRMAQDSAPFAEHLKTHAEEWRRFEASAALIAPFVCDAEANVRNAINAGKTLLLEGAQGALLDIDHGTYPFVTSSSTAAGGSLASLGFSPKRIKTIYGVAKAYLTRVGEGPFPTELHDDVAKHLSTKGKEFGATTGRPRRCGWLDAVSLRYAAEVNGLDAVILNKFDILSGLSEIKMAVAYEHPKLGKITDFPWDLDVLKACKPIYKTFKGWPDEVPTTGRISDLPKDALTYVRAVEEAVGIPVAMVGTGVNRGDALYR